MKSSLKSIAVAILSSALMFTGLATAAQAETKTYEHTLSCATTGGLPINVPATATDVKFHFAADCTGWGVMGGNANGMFVNYTGSGTGVTPTSTFAGNWFGPITNPGNDSWITGTLMENANNNTITYGVNVNLVILYKGGTYIFVKLAGEEETWPEVEEPVVHTFDLVCTTDQAYTYRNINVPETATALRVNFGADCAGWTVQGGNANGLFINQTSYGAGFTMTNGFAGNWYGTIDATDDTAWIEGDIMASANNDTIPYAIGVNLIILSKNGNLFFVQFGEEQVEEEEPTYLSGEIASLLFPGNKAWLKKAAKNNLKKLADTIAASETRTFEITGYAPVRKVGKKAPDYAALALARANAVAKYLTMALANRDIEVTITVKAEAAPKALRKTYEFLKANRKVTISVPALDN
jgi:outer membrane protein OmpA-like peptidoglycan-associated protein